MNRGGRILLSAACAVALVAGCTDSEESSGAETDDGAVTIATGPEGYGAIIRRTSDGVPHVYAEDLAGVTFGQGWASAEDHPCDLVDQIIEVQSERAATFGPGEEDEHLDSDFGWAALGLVEIAADDWVDVEGDERTLMEAFAAGWNASFEEQGADGIDDWCTGADWLRPVTPQEVYTYSRAVTLLASGARLVGFIAGAQPPETPADDASAPGGGTDDATTEEASAGESAAAVPGPGDPSGPAPLASNAWAIGSERSEDGGAMLIGNPHFPWTGELRFSEVQLTTEEGLDVYGAQLLGLPGVGLGFTQGVAWSHTVSAGKRFTAYTMELTPGDPTSYQMDGESVAMESRDITVGVLGDDGEVSEQTRTYWSTEFGPVLDFPGVGWTDAQTVSYRDANLDNDRLGTQYLAMNRANSISELQAAQQEYQGIPLFNTIAAGADGSVWYADTAAAPNLSPEAVAAYEERLEAGGLTALAADSGAVLLEGNTARDRWVEDPEAPWPGVLPWSALPQLERDDYVVNANDSYWVTNADALFDDEYSPLQGEFGTARSVRTLENLSIVAGLGDDAVLGDPPAGDDGKFSFDELMDAALRDSAYTEQQWRPGVLDRCATIDAPVTSAELVDEDGAVVVAPTPVDLSEACEVLEAWDGRYDIDSRGPAVWREFVEQVEPDELWSQPFDPERPATTPAGLVDPPTEGPDPVMVALASSVALLQSQEISLDVPLGEVQWDARVPDQRLPVPGGLGGEGISNVVSRGSGAASTTQEQPETPENLVDGSTLTSEGYPIAYGTSFLLAVHFTDDGPDARTILTYGQVGDPELPAFISGMKAFAAKDWKTVRFTQEDILADPGLEVTEVSA